MTTFSDIGSRLGGPSGSSWKRITPYGQAMAQDALAHGGTPPQELRVDGGACVNDLLMQFQADLLGIPVVRPRVTESAGMARRARGGRMVFTNSSMSSQSLCWQSA